MAAPGELLGIVPAGPGANPTQYIFRDPNSPTGMVRSDEVNPSGYSPVIPDYLNRDVDTGEDLGYGGSWADNQTFTFYDPVVHGPYTGGNPFNDGQPFGAPPVNPNYGGTVTGEIPAPQNTPEGLDAHAMPWEPWPGAGDNSLTKPDGSWQSPDNGQHYDLSGHIDQNVTSDPNANSNPTVYNPNAPYGKNPTTGQPLTQPPPPPGVGNVIAIRGLGTGGEVYIDSTYLSLCAEEKAQLGDPIPDSYAADEGARSAEQTLVFSFTDTRIVGRNDVHVDAEEGTLFAKGEAEANFWSPTVTKIYQQDIAAGGPEFAAIEMTPNVTEFRANINDLRLYSKDDVRIEGGDQGSEHGDVLLLAARDVTIRSGDGAGPTVGLVSILSNKDVYIDSNGLFRALVGTTFSVQSEDWFRISANNATDFSGLASNQIVLVKGQEETWIGHDDLTISQKTSINSLDETRVDCNGADIKMLAGGEIHIEAQTDLKLEGVNCYIGNDASGDPWKRLVHEDFVFNIFNNHFHGGIQSGSDNSHLPSHTGSSSHMTYFAKGN